MAYVISAKAARALTGIIRGRTDSTAPTYTSASISFDDFPAPFSVRWSQAENNGQGTWVIWLPDDDKLVMVDGSYVTIGGTTAATILPTGWYTVDDLGDEAEAVWLTIHVPEEGSTASVTAELSDVATRPGEGESAVNLLVATMETKSGTGFKFVKQFIDSAVVLGSGGSGQTVTPDDTSTQFIPHDDSPGADNTHEGELEVKGWDKGTPTSATTIAADLLATSASGHIVFRNSGGTLEYKPIGALALTADNISLNGYNGSQNVPYAYDGPRSDGKLYALTRTWTFADGILKSVAAGPDVVVADTVEHSGL